MIKLTLISLLFPIICLMIAITPYITRKTENFGISIPASQYDRKEFKKLRHHYTAILLGIGILFFIVLLWNDFALQIVATEMLFTYLIVGYVIISFLLYLPYHFKMKKIKETEMWEVQYEEKTVIDLSFRNEKLTYSNWYFLIPGFICALSICTIFLFHDSIPEQIPVHFSLEGNITYQQTSLKAILLLPFIQIFILILFLGINIIIQRSKQQIDAENPDISKLQNILYRRRWSLFIIIMGILLQLLLLFQQLTIFFESFIPYLYWVSFIFTILMLLAVFILVITTGQGGSRIQTHQGKQQKHIDRNQDKFWKLGQFYVNRNDPAIFIEKRFGVGWTNNWAHPISWILLILLFAMIISFIYIGL